MRSKSPLSWGNQRAAQRKRPKLLVYAQGSLEKWALVALSHTVLIIVYHILNLRKPYR